MMMHHNASLSVWDAGPLQANPPTPPPPPPTHTQLFCHFIYIHSILWYSAWKLTFPPNLLTQHNGDTRVVPEIIHHIPPIERFFGFDLTNSQIPLEIHCGSYFSLKSFVRLQSPSFWDHTIFMTIQIMHKQAHCRSNFTLSLWLLCFLGIRYSPCWENRPWLSRPGRHCTVQESDWWGNSSGG